MSVSVFDYVHSALRDEILSLRLEPGTRLRIDELASRYDVSHTPVRQALLRLEAEQLVTRLPRRGARVAALTYDELEEIQCIRLGVEPVLAEEGVRRARTTDVHRLEQALDRMVKASRSESLERCLETQRTFRELLYERADRPRLYRVATEQRTRAERYLRHLVRDVAALRESFEHQEALMAEVRANEPEAAASATTAALRWTLERLGPSLHDGGADASAPPERTQGARRSATAAE